MMVRIHVRWLWYACALALALAGPPTTCAESARPEAARAAELESDGAPAELTPPRPPPPAAEPQGMLTLRDAVAAALLGNRTLAGFSWKVRAREARAVQAGRRPNPVLGVEVENFGGSGARASFDEAETTIWLSQLVELGGKRPKRRHVAALERELARWDYEAARLDVLSNATEAFIATLEAQEHLALLRELESFYAQSLRRAEARHRAGATLAAARTQAAVALSQARVRRARAGRELAARRAALAATWGSHTPAFDRAGGDLSSVSAPPPLSELEDRIMHNPSLARRHTALVREQAVLDLQRARGVPDPTLSLGGRHFQDNDDTALVLAVSVPLPLFDRNQGNVLAAAHTVQKARADREAEVFAARSMLVQRYGALASAFEQIEMLREHALPAARAAVEETHDAYRKGRLPYLDVLDAQRSLFTLRTQHLAALASYQRARIALERLTATPIEHRDASGDPR